MSFVRVPFSLRRLSRILQLLWLLCLFTLTAGLADVILPLLGIWLAFTVGHPRARARRVRPCSFRPYSPLAGRKPLARGLTASTRAKSIACTCT